MPWSLNYLPPRAPALLDALFLSIGRSLHLANEFESKCQYVLRITNLVDALKDDPVTDLEQAISSLPPDQMLGSTLRELVRRVPSPANHADMLRGAKDARNFIAHEGGAIGNMSSIREVQIMDHVDRLRSEVARLAVGDNIVSRICFAIDEPRETVPQHLFNEYPGMVDRWVFGHFGFSSEE